MWPWTCSFSPFASWSAPQLQSAYSVTTLLVLWRADRLIPWGKALRTGPGTQASSGELTPVYFHLISFMSPEAKTFLPWGGVAGREFLCIWIKWKFFLALNKAWAFGSQLHMWTLVADFESCLVFMSLFGQVQALSVSYSRPSKISLLLCQRTPRSGFTP